MATKKLSKTQLNKLLEELIPQVELTPKTIEEVTQLPSFLSKIKALEQAFNCSYSALPITIQEPFVLRRLQQMINTIRLNPLWNERIEKAGVTGTPTSYEEWQALPISDKASMNEYFMGERPGLVVPLKYGGFEIVASGGTSSGIPAETVYSLRELHDTYQWAGKFMGEHLLPTYFKKDGPKWVVTTLADYQMWSSGTMVGGVLQHIPGINYIGAGPLSKEVYQHMMTYEGEKAIMAISQGIAYLTELGKGLKQEAKDSFRVALYGSGVITNQKQKELKELYPNLEILSYFAATQAETIGLQLDAASPNLASIPGLHLIEIVDDEGKWVKEGEEGELVVTRLHAHEAPLLRFRLGDRMIRRANLNTPTLQTQQFEFAGRSSDVIHLCDTQYPAAQAYEALQKELKSTCGIELEQIAQEIQFVNYRKENKLVLKAAVDTPNQLNEKLHQELPDNNLHTLFMTALVQSLPLFNKSEANFASLEKTNYKFNIKFTEKDSTEIHRTPVGKTPLIRDIF